MFDLLPNLLTALIAQAYPIYAAHRALTTINSNPVQPPFNNTLTSPLKPHLIYLVTLSTLHTLESLPPFSLASYLPLYAYLRLFTHLYLLLPLPGETTGAQFLYDSHIAPFLNRHSRTIEDALQRARAAAATIPGYAYAEALLRQTYEKLQGWSAGSPPRHDTDTGRAANQLLAALGLSPASSSPSPFSSSASAATGASARSEAGAQLYSAASAAFGLLSSAAAAAGSDAGSRGQNAPPVPGENEKLKRGFKDDGERLAYVKGERERLRGLLEAYVKEESRLCESVGVGSGGGAAAQGMGRSKSEAEFEVLREEDVGVGVGVAPVAGTQKDGVGREGKRKSSGWGSWIWGNGAGAEDRAAAREKKDA